jgi:hypothetical protein
MMPSHSTFTEGGYSPEAGVKELEARMTSGRFKVAAHLSEWFEEFRFYHRKDGLLVRQMDDLMSATRQVVMAKRFGQAVGLGGSFVRPKSSPIAQDVDFDVF